VNRDHGRYLHESVQVFHREGGVIKGVEKRYLELAADLNVFNGSHDQTITRPKDVPKDKDKDKAKDKVQDKPKSAAAGAEEEESAPKVPIGKRSGLTFGMGPGLNYQSYIGALYETLDNPKKQEQDTYTLYMFLACQLGLFGALAWAWLLFDGAGLARTAYSGLRDRGLRTLALGVYGALVAVIVYSVWGTLLIRGTGLMLFTLLAVAARLEQLVRMSREDRSPANL
jgi:hypothetical protein